MHVCFPEFNGFIHQLVFFVLVLGTIGLDIGEKFRFLFLELL